MIDYNIISKSVAYYEGRGFNRIETPWYVTQTVADITTPKTLRHFSIKENGKVLVGSGEQSFLYMLITGQLSPGRYQTITPCFRNDEVDLWHNKYFLKNELIETNVTESKLEIVVSHALIFFRKYLPDAHFVKTPEGFDIMWNNYELGSYGIRKYEYIQWIYGTGVAEPRLSNAIKSWDITKSK